MYSLLWGFQRNWTKAFCQEVAFLCAGTESADLYPKTETRVWQGVAFILSLVPPYILAPLSPLYGNIHSDYVVWYRLKT